MIRDSRRFRPFLPRSCILAKTEKIGEAGRLSVMAAQQNGTLAKHESATAQGGLFGDFFNGDCGLTFDRANLIDARGRRVFDMTRRACEAGVYPFQLALEAKSGPWVQAEGRRMLMLSSYDYLGLIGDPRVDEAAVDAIRKYGTGTGGVRMLTGTI